MFDKEKTEEIRNRKVSPKVLKKAQALLKEYRSAVFRGEMKSSDILDEILQRAFIYFEDEATLKDWAIPHLSMSPSLRTKVLTEEGESIFFRRF